MKVGIVAPFDALAHDSGAAVRTHGIAMALSASGADIAILHYGSSQRIGPHLEFRGMRKSSFPSGGHNYLFLANPFFQSDFRRFLDSFHPDVIQCEQPWAAIAALTQAKRRHLPIVLDSHNVETLWTLSASKLPALTVYAYLSELIAITLSNLVLTISDSDKAHFERIFRFSGDKLYLVPNGVELSGVPSSLPYPQGTAKPRNRKNVILFHGSLTGKQNEEAAVTITRHIAPFLPEADFVIIGKGPSKELLRSADQASNVKVLGFVPSIWPHVREADVCIAPIFRGSGIRLKLLDYMASGKPIVATHKAAEGLALRHGVNALLFDDAGTEFINAIRILLGSEELRRRLGQMAYGTAKKYDWNVIGKALVDRYETLLKEESRSRPKSRSE